MDKPIQNTTSSNPEFYGYQQASLRLRALETVSRRFPDLPTEELLKKAQEVWLWALIKNVGAKK